MKIASLNPLHAEVVMRSDLYGQIEKDMQVTLYPEGAFNQPYQGKARLVDPMIDAASSTFGIRIELDNPEQKIPAGLRCRISFSAND